MTSSKTSQSQWAHPWAKMHLLSSEATPKGDRGRLGKAKEEMGVLFCF